MEDALERDINETLYDYPISRRDRVKTGGIISHLNRVAQATGADILWSALQSIPLGIIVVDLKGDFLVFNQAAERMLGVGAAKMHPSDWAAAYGCCLPDKVTPYPTDRLPLLRAMRGETVTDEPMYIKNPQRQPGLWISVSGHTLRDEDGAISGGMVVFQDISEQRLAEEGLDAVSQQMWALMENQQAGILIESDERRILQANQVFCDLFDIAAPPADLIGLDCSAYAGQFAGQLVDPEGFLRRIEQLLREGTPAVDHELLFADGRTFQRDYIPIIVSGESRVHLWQYRDITERKSAQTRMSTYRRLCSALEQTADSVLITDCNGIIDYVNPGFETTTGYKSDEAVGKTPAILKSGQHDQEFYRELWMEISAGRPFRCTVRNRKKTGELYWAQQTITPIREAGGEITHYVSVLKDITDLLEKKEKEAKLHLVRVVQQKFYETSASLPGFDIAGAAFPADETGGDYFDFIDMPDGCLGIVVGDVSGHGIGTALVMTETRALVRAFASHCSDVAKILSQVNQLLVPDLDSGQFVTLFICRLDPRTRELTYASAGHNPGFLLDQSGGISRTLGGTGIPLGLYADSWYSSDTVTLSNAGAILLLSTDGLVEAMDPNDSQFGIERLIQHIAYQGHQPARQIIDGLFQAVRTHASNRPQQDDITAVILKTI
ncbi:MAG: SpoIIE family protein phosphatase [candidate division Zixibacteria bacterium]|nr:SpoIIE family protein phosphatase [candidate division Zixibacteria bacterium]